MFKQDDYDDLIELFSQAGEAHHEAFKETDGDDPEWPIWYAGFLHAQLNPRFCPHVTRSRLVHLLVQAEDEREAIAPDSAWVDYYAKYFLEHFAKPEVPADDQLALYYMPTCPFCLRVLGKIEELGLDVELRNTIENSDYRDELMQVRGRATVPVLRITEPDGDDRWMPESADIVAYLDEVYGEDAAA